MRGENEVCAAFGEPVPGGGEMRSPWCVSHVNATKHCV